MNPLSSIDVHVRAAARRLSRRAAALAVAVLGLTSLYTAPTVSASVVVDDVTCRRESSEIGSDEVYVIAFRGNTTAPFASNVRVHGPGRYWDDFDTREGVSTDVAIAQSGANRVHVVMVVEEDGNRDISGTEVTSAWRAATALVWQAQMLTVLATRFGAPTEEEKRTAALAVGTALQGLAAIDMAFPRGNDDVIGRAQQVVVEPGSTASYVVSGDGSYRLRFKIE